MFKLAHESHRFLWNFLSKKTENILFVDSDSNWQHGEGLADWQVSESLTRHWFWDSWQSDFNFFQASYTVDVPEQNLTQTDLLENELDVYLGAFEGRESAANRTSI